MRQSILFAVICLCLGIVQTIRVGIEPRDVEYIAETYNAAGEPETFSYAALQVQRVAVNARRRLIYAIGSNRLSVLAILRNKTLQLLHTETSEEFEYESIQLCRGFVSIAARTDEGMDDRILIFREYNKREPGALQLEQSIDVGESPGHHVLTRNCRRLIVIRETSKSLAVVDFGGPMFDNPVVRPLLFEGFDDQEDRLINEAFIIPDGDTFAESFDPRWICLNSRETKAYISLYTNNAIAVVDLRRGQERIKAVKGLGLKVQMTEMCLLHARVEGAMFKMTASLYLAGRCYKYCISREKAQGINPPIRQSPKNTFTPGNGSQAYYFTSPNMSDPSQIQTYWSKTGGTKGFDGTNTARTAELENHPVFSTFNPTQLSCITVKKQDYIFLAGTGIPLEKNVGSISLEDFFPESIAGSEELGDLLVYDIMPLNDLDGDNRHDRLINAGSRGFAVLTGKGLNMVAETGSSLEFNTMNSILFNGKLGAIYNVLGQFDKLSVNMGMEPELVITKQVCWGRYIVMVGGATQPGILFVFTLDTYNIQEGFVFQDMVDGYIRKDSVFSDEELYMHDERLVSLREPKGLAFVSGRHFGGKIMVVTGSQITSSVELFELRIDCKAEPPEEITTPTPLTDQDGIIPI